jgi:hypothetical protein
VGGPGFPLFWERPDPKGLAYSELPREHGCLMKPIRYEACIYDHCTYALTQQNQAKSCVCVIWPNLVIVM